MYVCTYTYIYIYTYTCMCTHKLYIRCTDTTIVYCSIPKYHSVVSSRLSYVYLFYPSANHSCVVSDIENPSLISAKFDRITAISS